MTTLFSEQQEDRVDGPDRLPRVPEGYTVHEEVYYAKLGTENVWRQVMQEQAFEVQSSESFYGLGLFVLGTA